MGGQSGWLGSDEQRGDLKSPKAILEERRDVEDESGSHG